MDQRRVRVRHHRRRLLFGLIHHAPEEKPRCLRTHARQGRTPHRGPEWGTHHPQGLPLGYSKDLQEDKEPLFDAVDSVLAMLAVLPEMLRTARFDEVRMVEAAGVSPRHGAGGLPRGEEVPFREAHRAVGRLVRRCEELGVSLEDVPQDELAAAHPALSEVPEGLLTPRGSVLNKRSAGSTAPGSVDVQLRRAKAFLETMEGHSEGEVSEGSDRCG